VLVSAVFYGLLLGVAALWAWLSGRSLWVAPEHPAVAADPWGQVLRGLVAGTGFGVLVALLSRWSSRRLAWARRMNQAFAASLGSLTAGQILLLALLSSLGEEAFFRGAMQPAAGIWLTSLAFGAVHVPLERSLWPWPLMAFGVGLALGGLFVQFGTLAGPVAAHFTINLLNLWLIAGPEG